MIISLTTTECIEQLKLYADSAETLGNVERAIGFRKAAEFLSLNHEDFASEQTVAPNLASGLHCVHGYSFDCPEGCEDVCVDPPSR